MLDQRDDDVRQLKGIISKLKTAVQDRDEARPCMRAAAADGVHLAVCAYARLPRLRQL